MYPPAANAHDFSLTPLWGDDPLASRWFAEHFSILQGYGFVDRVRLICCYMNERAAAGGFLPGVVNLSEPL